LDITIVVNYVLTTWTDFEWGCPQQRNEMKCIYKKVYDLLWDGIRRMKPSISGLEYFNTKVLALIDVLPPYLSSLHICTSV